MSKKCPYCQDGKENDYGDAIFKSFDLKLDTRIYHRSPKIIFRNNRYFMSIENFNMFEIKACPICGRSFAGGGGNND